MAGDRLRPETQWTKTFCPECSEARTPDKMSSALSTYHLVNKKQQLRNQQPRAKLYEESRKTQAVPKLQGAGRTG